MFTIKSHVLRRLLLISALVIVGTNRADAADDTMDRARLEKMLADGDTGMIVQAFKRHPGRTLPFIDKYLEGGLAMIEKGENPENALKSFRTGIKFAELADKAFEGATFSDYANSFAGFSPSEQKSFRAGQKAFKEGMKEADSQKARTRLEESLALARSLGDTWGQEMAWSGLAEVAQKAGDNEAALRNTNQALELSRGLQLREDSVQLLLMAATVSSKITVPDGKVRGKAGQSSIGYLAQAYALVQTDLDIDEAMRAAVLEQYVAALEAAGAKDRAALARREYRPASVTGGVATQPAN